jgi:HK97 family phage portal protein
LTNNAFVYVMPDPITGKPQGFYPLNSIGVELLEAVGDDETVYAKFYFMNGKTVVVPYEDVIHLRRFYYKNDMYGETNDQALTPTLQLITTINSGIINAVKSSAYLRGLLKFTQNMMKPEDIKAQRDDFIADYMDITNNGGVAALDAKADYTELKGDPKIIDDKTMALVRDNVYRYFNVSENIVMSKYTEDEWNAFYESVIEPLAVQMSLEFTTKLFSERELGCGNEITFEANRLQYASAKTKIQLAQNLAPLGLFTIDEIREVFNLAPLPNGEGDKRMQTLNVVDANKANKYQVGEDDENGEKQDTDPAGAADTAPGDGSQSGD